MSQFATGTPKTTAAPLFPSRQALFALIVLTLLNLLNYVDRYIFAALIPYIKQDVGYSDEQLGWIGSAFTIIYTVCSPLFGYLGDRYRRGRLIGLGIIIWSLATAAAGRAMTFVQMLLARSAVGIGEANYATIAPGLLSDFFPKVRRAMVMSIFFAAIPLGTAIGYLMGGYLGAPERLGWRHTLYLVGLPGLLTALAAWTMHEPTRGAMDHEAGDEDGLAVANAAPGWWEGVQQLLRNRGYVLASLGYAAVTFAVGALVFWAPEWLRKDKGMTAEEANALLGLCAILGGFLGTMLGGALADWLNPRIQGAFYWVCAGSALLAAPFTFLAIIAQNRLIVSVSIFLGMLTVFIANGPVNALLVNLVSANIRTFALGFVVVIIHVLGDGISLSLVGWISTWLQEHQSAIPGLVTSLGNVLQLNPVTQSLSLALLLMPLALVFAGGFYLLGLKTPQPKQP